MNEVELQQDVQRFTSKLMATTHNAAYPISPTFSPSQRMEALRLLLAWQASALDIAMGPVPAVNLLDMVVFVSLSRGVFDRYWLPEVFGEKGRPFSAALGTCEAEVWRASEKVLSGPEQKELRRVVDTWLVEHPDQTRAELVRFSEFSKVAGETASAKAASGILASVKAATRAADEAVLLGERALFFAQRAPFLARLQVRLGAQEVVSDGIERVAGLEPLLREAQSFQPMLRDLSRLTETARETAKEARSLSEEARLLSEEVRPLVDTLRPLLVTRMSAEGESTVLEQSLGKAGNLSSSSLDLVRELRILTAQATPETLHNVARQADRILLRWLAYVVLAGALLMAMFWTGYYAVVTRTAAKKAMAADHVSDTDEHPPLRPRPL